MAGTSGCIPDYHVNFFGQLCEPASHPSRMTSPETGSQIDFEQQPNNAPVPSRTADDAPAPDPVAKLFKENQDLIRGLSCGNVETYLATIKEVFTTVRQRRKNACTEIPTEQRLVERHQVEQNDKSQSESSDKHQIANGDQHQNQHQVEHEPEHKHQQKEQPQVQVAHHRQEHLAMQREDQHQDQHQHQPQRQSHNPQNSRSIASSSPIIQRTRTTPSYLAKVNYSRKTIPCTACNPIMKTEKGIVKS